MAKDICARKHKGSENSVAANKAAEPFKTKYKNQVYALIARNPQGLTLKDIAAQLKKAVHEISGRISELKELKKIYKASTRLEKRRSVSVYKANKGAA